MKIKLLDKNCKPTYAHDMDACMDCRAREDVEWKFNGHVFTAEVPLGFKIEVPRDYALLLFSRSGMGFKDLTTLSNSVGVIDCGFIGEVKIKLVSHKGTSFPRPIKKGDRICQMMLVYRPKIYLNEVEELEPTQRGEGGFGSTDKESTMKRMIKVYPDWDEVKDKAEREDLMYFIDYARDGKDVDDVIEEWIKENYHYVLEEDPDYAYDQMIDKYLMEDD